MGPWWVTIWGSLMDEKELLNIALDEEEYFSGY